MLSFYPAFISIPNPQKGGLFLFVFFPFEYHGAQSMMKIAHSHYRSFTF